MTIDDSTLAKKYYYIGRLYYYGMPWLESDDEVAAEFFDKAALLGHPDGIFQCGMSYFEGFGREDVDYSRAFELFVLAGNDNGTYFVARCYHYGFGVKQSYEKAIRIYENLVRRGYSYAAMSLGHMYRFAEGVEKDIARAIEYYRIAAELGNAEGCLQLAKLYFYGEDVEKDEEQYHRWLDEWARLDVGPEDPYFYDECAPKEYEEAIELFRSLARAGDEECQKILDRAGMLY